MANGHQNFQGVNYNTLAGTREEHEPLLADEEQRGQAGLPQDPCARNPHAHLPVYANIHR
jgi:hypothetical protein